MTRTPPLNLALTWSVLALSACNETTPPTQPETARDQSPAIPSFALASNTWAVRARLPDPSPRTWLAAEVVNNAAGQPILYVLGGHDGELEWTKIQAYNYANNSWAEKVSEFKVSGTNGVGKIGNILYISGGYDLSVEGRDDENQILSSLYVYDPANDRLTRKADMPRYTAEGVTGVINGKLYVLAGRCAQRPGGCSQAFTRRLFRYNPATNTWATRPWSPHHHRGGAGGVINGKFYVAGGLDGSAYLDVYDPITNTWRTLAPMPEPRSGAAGAVLGGKLYVIGGLGPSGSRAVFAYDPVTNTWKTRASLNVGRYDLAAASLVTRFGNPKILAVGGNDDSNNPGRNELYTP